MGGGLRGAAAKKELGAFYTPDSTASSLAGWAIRTGTESVLEPSVGGGALLKAALIQAREIKPFGGLRQPLACDIDPIALETLRNELGKTVEFCLGDFLELDPRKFRKFDVVFANPPFTRNHSIDVYRRKELRERFGIEGPAGIWTYFLAHAMDFLVQGGRIASIVPGSALFTRYGDAFLRRMCRSFLAVNVYQLAERPIWSGGTEERGGILLAEGYFDGVCSKYVKGVWPPSSKQNYESSRELQAYRDLSSASRPLGDLASISIGAVTGCNSVFLLSEEERVAFDLAPEDLTLTVSRARHVEGITINPDDLVRLARNGQKTWLLTPRNIDRRGTPTRKRLATITKYQRRSTCWMNKRKPWWRIETGSDCHGVFTYMNERGPRLALTTAKIICTNTLHRVAFGPIVSEAEKLAAVLTFVSTFGQLAGEAIGRVYGGGVLKFELADARLMPVLAVLDHRDLPVLQTAAHRVDFALRAGAVDAAQELADEALLSRVLGSSWRSGVAELREALRDRRHARHSGRALGLRVAG
jgi:adenine-specific DNA-methyltransferase